MKRNLAFGIGYAFMFAVSFGWAASDPRHACTPQPRMIYCGEAGVRVMSGFLAGAVWPLYWAWTAAEYIRDERQQP